MAENHAYFTAGYNFDVSSSVVVTPNTLIKAVLPGSYSDSNKFGNKNNYSFEGGVRATLDDKYWIGANYRQQESVSALLGLSFAKDNALRLGGAFDIITVNQFHLPVNKPVIVELTSKDVIHSFNIPVLRMKQDTIPGQRIPVWFQATQTGHFELACAQLCGLGHYRMRADVLIDSPEDYAKWEAETAPPPAEAPAAAAPAEPTPAPTPAPEKK